MRFYYIILSQDNKISSPLMTIIRLFVFYLFIFFLLRGIRTDLFSLGLRFICSCNFAFFMMHIRSVKCRCSRAVLALCHWQSLRHEAAVSRAETRDVRGRGHCVSALLHSFNKFRMNDLNICQGKWCYVSDDVSDK